MISFIVALLALITGYFIYGSFVERTFGVDPSRKTPCYTSTDGIDYTPMPTWKVFLIQFLNIAGTGPIFGAIQGILFGPAAYFWIVLGCIFGGAVHDYMSGMMSLRRNGKSLPEIVGDELGPIFRQIMRIMALILLVLVGAVFALSPAKLLFGLTSDWIGTNGVLIWTIIIFAYYFLATLLPIDKLIGKIYPLFGLALLIMAVGVGWGIFSQPGFLPEISDAFTNHHPNHSLPIFPGLCITIACGAVSGFHATQSPMMARCMKNEKYGRPIFFGTMITEGLVALIWAAAAIKFADSLAPGDATPYEKLITAMDGNPANIVNLICNNWLGSVGAVLAILGVVAAPITTGDTALRSARLIAADFLHFAQNKIYKRLILCIPIFLIAIALVIWSSNDKEGFQIIWRYFAWFNQTLSVFTFWTITIWLSRQHKFFYVTLLPALFMTMVCSTYIIIAPEGLHIMETTAYILGGIVTAICLAAFIRWHNRYRYPNATPRTKEGRHYQG